MTCFAGTNLGILVLMVCDLWKWGQNRPWGLNPWEHYVDGMCNFGQYAWASLVMFNCYTQNIQMKETEM
jgi:hypothetical protein